MVDIIIVFAANPKPNRRSPEIGELPSVTRAAKSAGAVFQRTQQHEQLLMASETGDSRTDPDHFGTHSGSSPSPPRTSLMPIPRCSFCSYISLVNTNLTTLTLASSL
jgi:hypothetical protein